MADRLDLQLLSLGLKRMAWIRFWIQTALGIVVMGGLVLSTLLTLLIVPAGFSLADSFERRVGPWLRAKMLTYKPGDETRPVGADVPDLPFPGLAKGPSHGPEPAE